MSGPPERARSFEDDLVAWGRAIRLETRGRRSGHPRHAVVGFVEVADGALLVATASDASHWAQNLQSEPRCRVEREGRVARYRARRLDPAEHRSAVRALILKYGTPAERLGGGPSFRLDPDPEAGPPLAGPDRPDQRPGELGT